MKVNVIIATYNKYNYLQVVLNAYTKQTFKDFSIIIADDGSNNKTKKLIERLRNDYPYEIKHIWHEDNGFRKCKILNKAIRESDGDYLIFTDDDCVPFKDFVETHIKYAQKGYFLSGGAIRLPKLTSNLILDNKKIENKYFTLEWLIKNGLPNKIKYKRFFTPYYVRKILDIVIPVKKTFNGGNSSVFKEDILAVGGFNEQMGYFAEDVEVGYRMINNGAKSKRVRHQARMLHLEHPRGYICDNTKEQNKLILNNTIINKVTFVNNG